MDFERRLTKAVSRGRKRSDAKARMARAKALSEKELKRLHSQYRLRLSDHIEACFASLPEHFPGFQQETIYGERGWGAACRRDDVGVGANGRRANYYSRLELTVGPFSSAHVLELSGKGTIRNKEVFNRTHFEKLQEADPDHFVDLVDLWVLEYAELFAANG